MVRHPLVFCLAALVSGLGSFSLVRAQARDPLLTPAWVEVGEGGQAIVRVVVSGPQDCPAIRVDGHTEKLTLREPVPEGLRPACEFTVPASAKSAVVNGQRLVLPRPNPSHVVVLGDTGCRIKDKRVQDCNDMAKWPFQGIAARAAGEHAQLIIHVGDYLYRETPCPAGSEALCGGTPTGDNWPTWDADFFSPAAKLLAAAPWAFSRGNHEDCARSWRGWFYYLDPRPFSGTCALYSAPYLVKLGRFELVMLDSSAVKEDQADAGQIEEYSKELASVHPTNAWVVAHHPFWGFRTEADGKPFPISVPLEAAWDKIQPKGINLALAGHVHLFELLIFDHGRPPQLVAGDGGTDLAIPIRASVDGSQIQGAKIIMSGSQHEYGFTVMHRKASQWRLSLKSVTGSVIFKYSLPASELSRTD
jgi:hypothetical protein